MTETGAVATTPSRERRSEIDIARPVVAYLTDLRWDVHQEVAIAGGGSSRADIVGTQGQLLYVVEVKASLSLALIEQAIHWLPYAHYVSVAIPKPTRGWRRGVTRGARLAEQILRERGIGLLHVSPDRYAQYAGAAGQVTVELAPTIGRRRVILADRLRRVLSDETRTYAEAGNAENRYWTPFRRTCDEVRRAIQNCGPLTTKQLVERIRHHYASDATARSTLPKWLAAGKVAGVVAAPIEQGKCARWQLAATGEQ
jgi:hypothetical protein